MTDHSEVSSSNWKRQRLRVLARDQYICYICGGTATAVDHIYPRALGGESSLDNLAAICKPCNSSKGSRARPSFLGSASTPPVFAVLPSPSSTRKKTEPAQVQANVIQLHEVAPINKPKQSGAKKKKPLIGATKPRIMTAKLKGESLGDDFAAFAAKCGMPLMPWQKYCADDFLTIDKNGDFVKRTVCLLVSRQCGKTTLAALLIIYMMFERNTQSVLGISSQRGMARDTFEKVASIIENNPFLFDQVRLTHRHQVASRNNGMEKIVLKTGAKYEIVAGTEQGSRGKSASLLFLDEVRYLEPEVMAAAKPVTRAMPNALTIMTSNAGTKTSYVLNDLRERALATPPPSLGWYEYSAPPWAAIDDRAGWAAANPALGYRITEDSIIEAMSTDSVENFRQETLCQWVSSTQSPWPYKAFENLADPSLVIAPGPQTFFAFDVESFARRSAALMVGQMQGEKIAVKILQSWHNDDGLDDTAIAVAIKSHADEWRPTMICHDHYTTASIAEKLSKSGQMMTDIVGQNFYQASMDLLNAIVAKQIVHDGSESLIEQMEAVAAKRNDGGWRIIRKGSAGDISAPIALAMLVNQMIKPQSVPMIITG